MASAESVMRPRLRSSCPSLRPLAACSARAVASSSASTALSRNSSSPKRIVVGASEPDQAAEPMATSLLAPSSFALALPRFGLVGAGAGAGAGAAATTTGAATGGGGGGGGGGAAATGASTTWVVGPPRVASGLPAAWAPGVRFLSTANLFRHARHARCRGTPVRQPTNNVCPTVPLRHFGEWVQDTCTGRLDDIGITDTW